MAHDDRWIRFAPEVTDREPATTALVLTGIEGGRVIVRRLLIAADRVDSALVSRFPIGHLEEVLNAPQVRESVEAGPPNTELSKAVERALATGDDPVRQAREAKRTPRPKLRRPTGSEPDAFYALVADAYEEAAIAKPPSEGRRVIAAKLAEEAGVPIPTVYRWIAEARRRGHIPPARRGKR